MTISTTKTWQFNLNNYVPPDATVAGNAHFDRRNLMLGIKNALAGFSTLPWTVTESSDSSTATGGTDKWIDEGDLVWRDDDTSNVFSWIVLRQTGISATFELLIACEEDVTSSDGAQIAVWVAQAGFSGGTTTVRPTATDERQLLDSTLNGFWGSGANGGAGFNYRWHAMQSTDGQCTRVLIFINEVNTGFWLFDKPRNPVAGWTAPYVAVVAGVNNQSTNQCSYAQFHDSAGLSGRFSGTDTAIYMSSEGFGTNASGENLTVANQVDGSLPAGGIGLCSLTTSFVGRNGEVFDLWWGLTIAETGRYYPDTGTKSYVQVSDMIFPWDGSTLLGTK